MNNLNFNSSQHTTGGVRTILVLALCLATGFLLATLSCALYGSWWPLAVVFTYCLAPLPNMIFSRLGGAADDPLADLSGSGGALEDAGKFITAMMIVSGFGFPVVLYHAGVIVQNAMLMSISGGLLVYGTIIAYMRLFSQDYSSY
ncbi:vacuolar protein sorting-associated protein [Ramicandelaber brevisporus]|nr:vacuolar protein sorting-associated protein [Ramicandelaber brevisporus]